MKVMLNVTPGQQIILYDNDRYHKYSYRTIESVGRKYFTLRGDNNGNRYRMEDGYLASTYRLSKRVYTDLKALQEDLFIHYASREMANELLRENKLSYDQVQKMVDLLGIGEAVVDRVNNLLRGLDESRG